MKITRDNLSRNFLSCTLGHAHFLLPDGKGNIQPEEVAFLEIRMRKGVYAII